MGPSSVGALPPLSIVELLGNIYRYISRPTGYAGEDSEPTGIDLSSILDMHRAHGWPALMGERSTAQFVGNARGKFFL